MLNKYLLGLFAVMFLVVAVFIGLDIRHGANAPMIFGAGYSPVTGYETQTTSRVSASATTIPVASVSDRAGNVIVPSNISSATSVRMYFNFEPGTTREEPFVCTGISGLNLTGCSRGISFQGSDLTPSSTLAQAHNAGSTVIMTNLGVMYGNEFLGVYGAQTKFGILTYDSFPVVSSTTAVPTAANMLADKYYVDNVGAGGFTSSNVSTTLGMQAIVTGTPNCPSAAACVGVNASTTASTNEGFLTFTTTTGKLAWNLPVFLGGSYTFTGTNTFASIIGTSTMDNLQITGTPNTGNDAVNKNYADTAASYSYATGTAGTAITPGQTLYISTTGTLFLASANQNTAGISRVSAANYVGISNGTYAVGDTVSYVKPGGVVDTMTGLTTGKEYYLSNTQGAVAVVPGGTPVRVGVALSANRLQLTTPSFRGRVSGLSSAALNSNTTITLGFVPTRIDFICNPGNSASGKGWWMVNSDGTTSTGSVGNDTSTAGQWMTTNSKACQWNEGGTNTAGFWVTTTTNGFIINGNGYAQTRNIYYTASVDDLYFP